MPEPLVGIVMGSESDLPVMWEAIQVMEDLEIAHEVNFVSAHRTPDWLRDYATSAEKCGSLVIIAGAGGAAHLPGMIAAWTTVPVVAVPVKSRALSGWDSLLSIAQMPPGVPVGTMAIDGAKNAGLYAARIIANGDPRLRSAVKLAQEKLRQDVTNKNEELQRIGWKEYLANMPSSK